MIRRDLVTAVGVLAAVVGVILTLASGPLARLIDGAAEPIVGSWTPGVVLLGLVLASVGIVCVRAFRHEARKVPPLREPVEHRPRAPVVGDSFDELLARATDPDRPREVRARDRERLETGLRELARESYALATDCDEETAAAAIDAGTWCGDRRATSLLGGPNAPTPSPWVWLLDLLRSESAYARRVRHAVAAIDRLANDDRSEATGWADGASSTSRGDTVTGTSGSVDGASGSVDDGLGSVDGEVDADSDGSGAVGDRFGASGGMADANGGDRA